MGGMGKSHMTVDAIRQLISSKDPRLGSEFEHWLAQSEGFGKFAKTYEAEIRSRIRGAKTRGNLAGLRFELEMAYLLLKDGRFSVKWLRPGSEAGPDFDVTYKPHSTRFYLEATWIPETDIRPQARFEKWKSDVLRQVRLEPSTLACCVYVAEENDLLKMQKRREANLELLRRLMECREAVVAHIINTARALEDRIGHCATEVHSVPGFSQGEIRLEYHRLGDNVGGTLDCSFAAHPIFNQGAEFRQFRDKWEKKIGSQMVCGEINVLAIGTDSKAHDALALRSFIEDDINKQAAEGNLERRQLWSGVLFRGAFVPAGSAEPNYLWFSTNDEYDYPIPEEIRRALRGLS